MLQLFWYGPAPVRRLACQVERQGFDSPQVHTLLTENDGSGILIFDRSSAIAPECHSSKFPLQRRVFVF